MLSIRMSWFNLVLCKRSMGLPFDNVNQAPSAENTINLTGLQVKICLVFPLYTYFAEIQCPGRDRADEARRNWLRNKNIRSYFSNQKAGAFLPYRGSCRYSGSQKRNHAEA